MVRIHQRVHTFCQDISVMGSTLQRFSYVMLVAVTLGICSTGGGDSLFGGDPLPGLEAFRPDPTDVSRGALPSLASAGERCATSCSGGSECERRCVPAERCTVACTSDASGGYTAKCDCLGNDSAIAR